jgi:alkanesulfonate monooxygenase SsuD/methylene tetrahydromethanopterin reductase-like flavin-dependent oxidoreductase (luciferase family)
MKLGLVFPQTEIGSDPAVIRNYAQAAESSGYDHLLVFDHVLGATLDRFDRLGRRRPYTDESPFHEVSSSSVTCCSQRLELVTGIVILPQRQTALVAKQAAAVDVRTGGRVRLGVGIGWNTLAGDKRRPARLVAHPDARVRLPVIDR